MIHIIDYGIGNLRSIEKAVEKVGADVVRSDSVEDMLRADRLILPGVGAFGACISELRQRGLVKPVRDSVKEGKPLLGVCVGLQMLFDESEEMGIHKGLGLLPGRVVRFASPKHERKSDSHTAGETPEVERGTFNMEHGTLKIPHMGWNQIHPATDDHPLLDGIPNGSHFYFVHSYHADPDNPADVLATCHYGEAFAAIVARSNVMGVQFHPEKSQDLGLRILDNFAKLNPGDFV